MSKISNLTLFTLSPLQSIPIPLPTLMQSNSTHFQNTHTNRQSPSSFLQSIPHFPQTIYAPTPIQTHTLLFAQHKTTNQHYHRLYTFFRLSTQNCSICPFCHHFPNTSNALTHSLIYTWTIMRSMHSLPHSAFIQMHFNFAKSSSISTFTSSSSTTCAIPFHSSSSMQQLQFRWNWRHVMQSDDVQSLQQFSFFGHFPFSLSSRRMGACNTKGTA